MGYQMTIKPEFDTPFQTHEVHNEAQFLKNNTSSDMPKHCLSSGGISGLLLSLSADKSVAFIVKDNQIFAVYREDCTPMPDLLCCSGTIVNLLESGAKQLKLRS